MEERTIKLYSASELKEVNLKAYARVLEKYANFNIEYDWYADTIDDQKTILETLGWTDTDIQFSGFWSQGDGASFTGAWKYRPDWREALAKYAPQDEAAKKFGEALAKYAPPYTEEDTSFRIVRQSSHYSHENTVGADTPLSEADQAVFLDAARDYMRHIYRTLETEYEYLSSETTIAESLDANGIAFTADGIAL